MTALIVPSFTKPQLLMDFLIECYDAGGSVSLLAINGLFHLISIKNLDYPNFYPKLYALLNADLFHVRYRSRFFRLLERFLESTHLPSALIASFIKRMARLCLNAPPGAIVTVVPFIYNLFKKHRACTYMIHRVGSAEEREDWRQNGYPGDPFDPEELDPMNTGAIDSCIWEIHTLMNHWHPNVATLCRIISEQFTKQHYSMEDFLDHSYGSVCSTLATYVSRALTDYRCRSLTPKQTRRSGNRPSLSMIYQRRFSSERRCRRLMARARLLNPRVMRCWTFGASNKYHVVFGALKSIFFFCLHTSSTNMHSSDIQTRFPHLVPKRPKESTTPSRTTTHI